MRRLVIAGLAAILLFFLGSLLLLDQLESGSGVGPTPTSTQISGSATPTQGSRPAPDQAPRPGSIKPEVAAQLAAPPTAPAPAPPLSELPDSGAPPTPAFVRERLSELQAHLTSRCGRVEVRLGDQLRHDGLQPGGQAVLLLDLEPLDDRAKVHGATVQSLGSTRPSLVACAQLHLKGHVFPVSYLRRGARVKVQVVVGTSD